jgi:hypothetical protein
MKKKASILGPTGVYFAADPLNISLLAVEF